MRRFGWELVTLLLCLLPTIWAGDILFVSDEPTLILKADTANRAHHLERVGLQGTVGFQYGPLPVWVYQVALRLTHNLVTIARLRAAGVMLVTLAAALWIRRLLRLPLAWVWVIALSPYLLFYSRGLWDNSFNIPLGALLVACTLQVELRKSLWPVPAAMVLAGAMLLVHPMSLALVAACGLFIAINLPSQFRTAGRRERWLVPATCLLVLLAGWIVTIPYRGHMHAAGPMTKVVLALPNGWWFAFLSPRLLSAAWLQYFFPIGYLEASSLYPVMTIARVISLAIFPLALAGVIVTLIGLRRPGRFTRAGLLALLILAAQLLLNGLTHTFGHPHYYNATWTAPALLAGWPMAWLARRSWGAIVLWLMPAALFVTSVCVAIRIHETGGTPSGYAGGDVSRYGPTLANQIALSNTIRSYDPKSRLIVRPEDALLPFSLRAINAVSGPPPANLRPVATLRLMPAHPDQPFDGRLIVVAGPPSAGQ